MSYRLSALLLPLAAALPASAQTAPAGAALYAPCKACHTIDKGGRNGLGPNLNGVVGRKAASVAGFNYSTAMKASAKTWTPAELDAYLADPRKAVPGNKMTYPGLKDAQKRAALIAWLKAQ
ncbi:MAG TPA: cytochrome c family protein [Sphingomonas sp.]|jgi:cytochrome c